MKVLITGGSSLLGRYLLETAPPNWQAESTWYTNKIDGVPMHHLDVCNQSQVYYVFDKVKPDLVIHCAANGNVDFAEQNYQAAEYINLTGTKNILRACQDYKAKIIYISTNAVFDGDNPPYDEQSKASPVNVYGRIKLRAEQVIADSNHWLIIRPFLLYGYPQPNGRQNWVTIICNKLSKGESLKIVNDTVWQPTYAEDCAKAIWKLSEAESEIFHVASSETITLYDFALNVCEVFDLDKSLIEPVSSDYFPTIAPRPRDTSYKLSKIHNLGVRCDYVKEGLERMRDELSG